MIRGGGNFRSSGIIGSVMESGRTSMSTVMESSSVEAGALMSSGSGLKVALCKIHAEVRGT